jgi:hypothetical protein
VKNRAIWRAGACLSLLLLLGACRSIPGSRTIGNLVTGRGLGSGLITQQELRDELVQYASRFEATVVGTAVQISLGTQDPVIQRRALRWKLGAVPVVNEAAFLPEPEAAYVAVLTIATSMHVFLTTGVGSETFGDQQSRAVAASSDLLTAARELGTSFLSEREHARVLAEVDRMVSERPMRDDFVAEGIQALVSQTQASGVFDWVTAIPLSPFRALTGVDEGAQGIREFNDTALRFSRIVASMPTLLRWNLELLALDLGRQPSLESAIASMDAVARSAQTVSETAQLLPETLRTLLEELDASGKSLTPLAASLERTAAEVGAAGNAWSALVARFQKEPADPAAAAGSRPFDIREWEQTAAQVSAAAAELRRLLESTRTLAGSEELPAALEALTERVEEVEARSRSLVDLAALRGLQLIVVFFVLLFLHRRLESWLSRRAAAR